MPDSSTSNHAIRETKDAVRFISRRHPEYLEYVETTRWILDTLEGGDQYRDANYGFDKRGMPVQNLYRHKREYPMVGVATDEFGNPLPFHPTYQEMSDVNAAIEADYELRRMRTPVPQYLSMFIERQLSKIYKRPIDRRGPDLIKKWADNIDGRQTTLDEWMRDVIAPLLCALGMIDVVFSHPMRGPDEPIMFGDDPTQAARRCVVSYALPENVLWWQLDYTNRYYLQVNIREFHEDIDPAGDWVYDIGSLYNSGSLFDQANQSTGMINPGVRGQWFVRHWTHEDWTLYDLEGKIVSEGMHNLGIVPVVRLFDRRNLRLQHSSTSRMWGVVDKSRAYYNEESELVANNTMHNCPLLQGPPEADDSDSGMVPIGRYYLLSMKEARNGVMNGYSYISPPTETSSFMQERLSDLQGRMERDAALTRSVGATGSGKGSRVVAQSGISKAYDQQEGSEWLAGISKMLEANEYTVRYFAYIVLNDGFDNVDPATFDQIYVIYPKEFNLLSFDQFAAIVDAMSKYLDSGLGYLPMDEKLTLREFIRLKHPDLGDKDRALMYEEIDTMVDEMVKERQNTKQLTPPLVPPVGAGQQPPKPSANSMPGLAAL